jgi:hypothetical protein
MSPYPPLLAALNVLALSAQALGIGWCFWLVLGCSITLMLLGFHFEDLLLGMTASFLSVFALIFAGMAMDPETSAAAVIAIVFAVAVLAAVVYAWLTESGLGRTQPEGASLD